MNCGICNKEMKQYESNNPEPLEVDRVCVDCNFIVTSVRIKQRFWKTSHEWIPMLNDWLTDVLIMSHKLRKAHYDGLMKISRKEELE